VSEPGLLRVAAAQDESVSGDAARNVATAVSLVEAAAAERARVVVLPELFLTGYDPAGWSPETSIAVDDDRLEPLVVASGETGTVVVVGAALAWQSAGPGFTGPGFTGPGSTGPGSKESDPASPTYTISLLVFAEGAVHAAYHKQHLFADERSFFTPGRHGATLVVDGWELGLGVCYDGCFPEHAAAAAADGATAYLCPSAYYRGSEHRRDLYYAARALDNGIYVVFSGLAGRCGEFAFNGGSAIYDPEGRPVDRVGQQVRAVATADLDLAEVRRVQEMNPVGRDRVGDLGDRSRLRVGTPEPART
jgi:5-aminopentanamidase